MSHGERPGKCRNKDNVEGPIRSENRRNGGALAPNEPIGSEGALMPRPGGSGFLVPFVKALENKKISEITLRLNNYYNSREMYYWYDSANTGREFMELTEKHIQKR
jgi:hypothetical protein